MKRILALLLAVLLLGGCVSPGPTETTPSGTVAETTTEPQAPTTPSEVLKTYEIPYADCYAAAPMGDGILFFTGVTETTLIKVRSRDLKEQAAAPLGRRIDLTDAAVRVTAEGVSYLDGNQIVILDAELKEVSRTSLPDSAICDPVITEDLRTACYAAAGAIRAIDLNTGLDRLLREISFPQATINAFHLNDTVLELTVFDESFNATTQFLSFATGELYQELTNFIALETDGEAWFAETLEDSFSQLVFGTGAEKPQVLSPSEDYAAVRLIPGMNGVLLTVPGENTTALCFYDLATGTRQAVLELEGSISLWSVWGDGNCVWFMPGAGQLCRWDLEQSTGGDSISCVGPYFTRAEPDTEGLAALEVRAQALEEAFGVDIILGEDALEAQPWDYSFTSEYQVPRLSEGLDALESALAKYPDGFLKALGKASNSGTVHISLIRSMQGSAEKGSLESPGGVQFWWEGSTYIALPLVNDLESNLHHELFHVIDTYVLSEDNAFDSWDRLNPSDFEYDYDYIANQSRDGSTWLAEGSQAFIDTYAMSFPTEDRARIFEYAMGDGNESCFVSDTMLKKLRTLCEGIRDAFGLENSEEVFLWEQYLK